MTQEFALCYFKYRFDRWRRRKLTFWRNTVTHWHHLKDSAKWFFSVLLIRMDMAFIDIHRKFLPIVHCLKSSNCNSLKTVYRNLIFVNAISIVFEIWGISVKMVCKRTFDEFENKIYLEKRNRACSARVSSYHITHEWTQNSRRYSVDLMI